MTHLLNDLDYLAELTNCLANTLARLVQQRPPDPITFIERSLRQHRRLHPGQNQERETSNNTTSGGKSAVLSPGTSSKQGKARPNPENVGSTTSAPALRQSLHNRTQEVDEDFIEDECLDLANQTNTVHKHFKPEFKLIGDLFDDDDFG